MPKLEIEKIAESGIYVINGPVHSSITTSLCCTGCGKRELYRFERDEEPHVAFKCPNCGSTSVAFLKDILGEETEK